MTDAELEDQIFKAVRNVLKRLEQTRIESKDDLDRFAVAEYLSGIGQMADFLMRKDGEVTPQQISRAAAAVAKRLGYASARPGPDGRLPA